MRIKKACFGRLYWFKTFEFCKRCSHRQRILCKNKSPDYTEEGIKIFNESVDRKNIKGE